LGIFLSVLGFVVVTIILSIWRYNKTGSDTAMGFGLFAGTFGAIALVIMLSFLFSANPDKVDQFKFEKPYLQGSDNYLLVEKKNNWNMWLMGAQRGRKTLGWFSFQPDEVMTLTPIE
jgi:hypothetical protein